MSFAPLVKETAPAVVNVYASKKPRETRSPFEGDPVLRAVLRPADAAARAELAGFGRRGRRQRPRRHELPCHPRRRRGEGRDVRRARIRQQGAAEGRIARPRSPEDRFAGAVSGRADRRFRRAGGRRPRACRRQPVRRRPDDDQRHRLGAGAQPCRRLRLRLLHPDRCGDQSRQFRRRADQHGRPARRHQHGDLQPQRRLDRHRLRHPVEHGARGDARRPPAAATTSSGPISARTSRK